MHTAESQRGNPGGRQEKPTHGGTKMGMTADLSLEMMQVRGQWSNTERAGGGNVDLTRSLYSATSFKNTDGGGGRFFNKWKLKNYCQQTCISRNDRGSFWVEGIIYQQTDPHKK